jgi:hypothetical protein
LRAEGPAALALDGKLRAEAHDDAARDRLLAAHHRARADAEDREWATIASGPQPIRAAERLTISKMAVERPAVETAKLGPSPREIAIDSPRWPELGAQLLQARGLPTDATAILDAQSRELVATLRPIDWQSGAPLDMAGRSALADAFARSIVADTGINLARLRPQIHAELARRASTREAHDFAALNDWLYTTVFLTPASDRWLGLATPGVFTGLPGDGVTTAG